MKLVLYTTHCPKCHVIESKLKSKNLDVTLIDNVDEVVKFGNEHNINSAPILVADDVILDFKNANQWIKEH